MASCNAPRNISFVDTLSRLLIVGRVTDVFICTNKQCHRKRRKRYPNYSIIANQNSRECRECKTIHGLRRSKEYRSRTSRQRIRPRHATIYQRSASDELNENGHAFGLRAKIQIRETDTYVGVWALFYGRTRKLVRFLKPL